MPTKNDFKKWKNEVLDLFENGTPYIEIIKKYPHVSKSTVKNKWLAGKFKRKEKYLSIKHRIIEDYCSYKGKNPPYIYELAQKYSINSQTAMKYLKKSIDFAPEDGVYEKKINGKMEKYLSIRALVSLFGGQVAYSTLYNLLGGNENNSPIDKIKLLNRTSSYIDHYSLKDFLDKFPRYQEMFNQIKIIDKYNIDQVKPDNLKPLEYLVLSAIVQFQAKRRKKPTYRQIHTILKAYNYKFNSIKEIIPELKRLKYIKLVDKLYIICRGTKDLIFEEKERLCWDSINCISRKMRCSYYFTADNLELLDSSCSDKKPNRKIISKRILDLINQ